jgi:hypothetical protein
MFFLGGKNEFGKAGAEAPAFSFWVYAAGDVSLLAIQSFRSRTRILILLPDRRTTRGPSPSAMRWRKLQADMSQMRAASSVPIRQSSAGRTVMGSSVRVMGFFQMQKARAAMPSGLVAGYWLVLGVVIALPHPTSLMAMPGCVYGYGTIRGKPTQRCSRL